MFWGAVKQLAAWFEMQRLSLLSSRGKQGAVQVMLVTPTCASGLPELQRLLF